MSAPTKIKYEITLDGPVDPPERAGVLVRPISSNDRERLAGLMLDAYVGTIDYEGETITEALEAVDDWLEDPSTRLDFSVGADTGGEIVAAALLSDWEGAPFIGIVMTGSAHKRAGYARLVVQHVLNLVAAAGHNRISLFITEGNTASEQLFAGLGAAVVRDASS